jgi:hypothetical protein
MKPSTFLVLWTIHQEIWTEPRKHIFEGLSCVLSLPFSHWVVGLGRRHHWWVMLEWAFSKGKHVTSWSELAGCFVFRQFKLFKVRLTWWIISTRCTTMLKGTFSFSKFVASCSKFALCLAFGLAELFPWTRDKARLRVIIRWIMSKNASDFVFTTISESAKIVSVWTFFACHVTFASLLKFTLPFSLNHRPLYINNNSMEAWFCWIIF